MWLPSTASRLVASARNLCSANIMKTRKWIFAKHFQGEPKLTDFVLKEEELPPIKQGEILCEAEWFSVDPYMRAYTVTHPTGITMIGSQVAKVIESKSPGYNVGDYVVINSGWQTHTIESPDRGLDSTGMSRAMKLPDMGNLSKSLALGVLGMTGVTSLYGFLDICKPKAGEVVVISGAAGAVGSHVGQIAKIKDCKVIGFAGSDDKVEWLKRELKFDAAYNYKTANVIGALKESAPDGVDCYFDNVGGVLSSQIISRMRHGGRVSVCGAISMYNESKVPLVPMLQQYIVPKELKIEGFLVTRWHGKWSDAVRQNMQWLREGKLKYFETVTEGFDNLPQAFINMLRGENTGKAVVSCKSKL